MKIPSCWLAVVIIALSAAGCTEVRWSRSDADIGKVEEDLAQCRNEARLQAERASPPHVLVLPPAVGIDAQGRAVPAPARSRTEDPLVMQQDLTFACMRGKGYALVRQ
jgi:hypothetical protein